MATKKKSKKGKMPAALKAYWAKMRENPKKKSKAKKKTRVWKQYFRSRRIAAPPPAKLYFNVGHTSLNTPDILAGLGAQGSFVAMNNVVSQSVAHLHLHVVPRTKGDGLRGFFWPRTTYADDEAAAYAERLRGALG